MKHLALFIFTFSSMTAFAGSTGSLSCFYELYAKSHFDKPITTATFTLDLNQVKHIETPHDFLKQSIHLHYSPATLDGQSVEHLNFSLTYMGAHAGAVAPMVSGRHVVSLTADNTDLAGAFLNCDVAINQ